MMCLTVRLPVQSERAEWWADESFSENEHHIIRDIAVTCRPIFYVKKKENKSSL